MKIRKLTFVFLMVTVHDIMSRQRWVERFPGAMGDSFGEETSYSLGGENSGSRIESVIEALRKVADVERQLHENKGCNKVDLLNITFDERRWKKEALLTVQVANLITSLWRAAGDNGYPVAANDALLYHYVRSIVLFSPSVFGSVICFDNNLYKNYTRFCPYAFRDSDLNGSVHVFDIASGDYDYTTDPNAIWWHKPKNKALTFKPAKSSSMYEERFNATAKKAKKTVVVPHVTFENGAWTRPYFDCFGGKVWMVTYLAPFFNETDEFLGVVSIDVVLSDIDINQCDNQYISEQGDKENLIEFMGTHLCKPSTKCETVLNQGFKRGSYVCTCKRGFYFPDALAPEKAFNGSVIEREHDRMLRGEPNVYENNFDCRRCSEGCDECVDGSPCIYTLKIVIRLLLCCLNGAVMVLTIVFAVYVALHWKDKIFKASSPRFMEIILLGAMLMYSTLGVLMIKSRRVFGTFYSQLVVSYFKPTDITCVMKPWLQHIGFSLVYGPLALKTWRVALIFRVRSAQKLALSDGVLLRRLCLLVLLYCSYLTAWTAFHPPLVETARTSGDLKYERCVENWFNLTLIFGDMMVLIWGMWLSYKIRNAPPAYNESKMISWAVYSAMFVTSFLMVLRITTKGNTNPDLLYGLDFVLIHMDCSTVIVLMFAHKYLLVRRMQRTVNDCTSSHNNMLVPEEEIVEEQSVHQEEQSLRKENQELKEEMRRLRVKLATLQSTLMKEDNHHMKKLSSGGAFIRRKSAFTLTRKGAGHVQSMKRHSLQLAPTLQDPCKDGHEISGDGPNKRGELRDANSELIPEFIEIGSDIPCPQELNRSAAFLHSDSLHNRIYHPSGPI